MIIGIVLANILLLAVLGSVWLLIRDVRKLHRGGKWMTEAQEDAGGVTAAGMAWQNNLGSH